MAYTRKSKQPFAESVIIASFEVPTVSPSWRLRVSIHPTSDALKQFGQYRIGDYHLYGATWLTDFDDQNEGVLAEIHLVADGLSELTIIHEAVHAGANLARAVTPLDAKKLAASLTHSQSAIMWREELQCRTVEIVTLAILAKLKHLNIPCQPLRESRIY